MESRIKGRVLAIIVAGAMVASTSTVLATTTKPTPKPTAKTTAKTTAKATLKPTPKPTVKAKPKTTKKPVKKKPVVRKPSPKKVIYKRKVVKVSPSPSPVWPPKTPPFKNPDGGEIYYKVPTNKELLGALTAAAALSAQISVCTKFACGAVTLASVTGCTWWNINSTVYGPLSATDSTPVPYGTLTTTAKGSSKKQIINVLLVSTEPLKKNIYVGMQDVFCHHDPVTTSPQKVPSNIYTVNTPTPAPTAPNVAVTNTN
jgi:hypothetical protein